MLIACERSLQRLVRFNTLLDVLPNHIQRYRKNHMLVDHLGGLVQEACQKVMA